MEKKKIRLAKRLFSSRIVVKIKYGHISIRFLVIVPTPVTVIMPLIVLKKIPWRPLLDIYNTFIKLLNNVLKKKFEPLPYFTEILCKILGTTWLKHGTIMRTRIICKKFPYYMRNSACIWRIFENVKIFWNYAKHFWIFPRVRSCRILLGLSK